MEIDIKQLAMAVKTIAEEKNLPEDTVKDVVEQALAAAYRRDFGDREQDVRVDMNLNTADVDVYVTKEVADKVEDELTQISLSDAQVMKKNAKIGDQMEIHAKPQSFGRVAAQTAKQVVLQRLREAERESIMEEYEDKIGSVVNGMVNRVEGAVVRIDLGQAQAIMPKGEQIQGERYYPGQRVKVYLKEIERGMRGPQLVVSRGNTQFVEWLFRGEVPEMENGSVEIRGIAREAGVRTKLAVFSTVPGVDPVGTFVGGHGTRVNAVMSEVGEQEKIDILVWSDDPGEYIIQALSPTKILKVDIDEAAKKATVHVPEDQQSIAIGRGGQNVRLAGKLTGYELDIAAGKTAEAKTESKPEPTPSAPAKPKADSKPKKETPSNSPAPGLKKKEQLESSLLEAIEEHGSE